MKSKDLKNASRTEIVQALNAAMAAGEPEQIAQAMEYLAENIENEVMQAAKDMVNIEQLDAQALAARGLRQLTHAEKEYYEAVSNAMRSSDPKQALANLTVTMPETIIESVFEDLAQEHELLRIVNFQTMTARVKWILNKNGRQKAKWGSLTAEFTKELEGEFEVFDATMYSLMAFMPVHKSILDLGATWLDAYVRAVLKEANAVGLEEAIVAGTGVDMPIGMMKDLTASKADGEPYPDKAAIPVTSLSPAVYGEIISNLAVSRNGQPRKIGKLVMVANPQDYFKRIMPATTVMRPDGTYANNVLPYPTEIIQCTEIPIGKAVVGIAENYFMGLGASTKEGVIQYDDSVRFIQNQRVYATFLYGNGKPVDNTSFLVLDISGLEPSHYAVSLISGTDTAAVASALSVGEDDTPNMFYSQEDLEALTMEKIRETANFLSYTIDGRTKAELIESFLAAQEAAYSV